MNKPFNLIKTDSNVVKIEVNLEKSGSEFWALLTGDRHHDNPDCKRDLELKHLDEAKELGAAIIDTGDLFCAMQGKYDKRSDKSKLSPEYQCSNYLDALVKHAADFYEPYAKNWAVFGIGNHETSIINKHETNLTERLLATLKDRTDTQAQITGYTGWVRFLFNRTTKRYSQILWHSHGYGGGGPVTEDLIQSARQRVYIENADIMVSGHVHRSWVQEFVRHRLTTQGEIQRRVGYYVKTPTYKDAYKKGQGGFEVEKGHGPRPLGAYWIRFKYNQKYGIETSIIKAN